GAGNIRRQLHPLACGEGADGVQPTLPVDALRLGVADLDRWLEGCEEGDQLADGVILTCAECRHYSNEEDKQDDESSQHGGRSRLDVGSIRLPTLIGNYVRRLTGHGG